jgi:Ca2+:H+ antiporter
VSRNSAQLILSVFLLKSGQLDTLRTSLLGGILANSLLMLPLGFLVGGFSRIEQFYSLMAIQTNVSISFVSIAILLVITVAAQNHEENGFIVVSQSRGASIIMLGTYLAYLWFGLKTHSLFFEEPSMKVNPRRRAGPIRGDTIRAFALIGSAGAGGVGGYAHQEIPYRVPEKEPDEPTMIFPVIFVFMVVFTALLAICTQFATDNLQGLVSRTAATQTFVGLILLPLLTVDPSTVKVAMEDKQDQNINSNLGANLQSTVGVMPFMVLLGWMLGIEFTLVFDTLQLVEVTISTMLVLYVTAAGKSNW